MQVINPGTIPVLAPHTAGGRFYDRHPYLVALADVVLQAALIATLFIPLHGYVGNADLAWTAVVFLGSLYIVWRILYERFLAPTLRREYALGFLAERPGVGVFMVLLMLPARLALLSAAMAGVLYDLVIDHGFANPFARSFTPLESIAFFCDQALRRLLFDLLESLGAAPSHLSLPAAGAQALKLALVPFRMAVEAISLGYAWYLIEPYWRRWKERIDARAVAAAAAGAPAADPSLARYGDGGDAPA